MQIIPLIFFAIMLNVSAQLLLKAGMNRLGEFQLAWANMASLSLQVASNPFIFCGVVCYVFSMIVWLLVLSRTEVSVAYPITSLGYVLNAIAAYYLFGENLTFVRILGTVVILIGVYLITRS